MFCSFGVSSVATIATFHTNKSALTVVGNPDQDVYYIHELQMESGYEYDPLKSKILEELPGLILSLLHVAPDILAFFPEPLIFTPDVSQEERNQILRDIAVDKVDSAFERITDKKTDKQDSGNLVKFADAYQFSDDEIKIVMGRRNSASSYPEQAKDLEEYAFYEANGSKEVGNSRLLYKYVGRG